MGLGCQVVNLLGLGAANCFVQGIRIGKVPVMEKKLLGIAWITAQVVNAGSVKRGGASHQAMHLIAFFQKQLR
jgi:hypothetical protein